MNTEIATTDMASVDPVNTAYLEAMGIDLWMTREQWLEIQQSQSAIDASPASSIGTKNLARTSVQKMVTAGSPDSRVQSAKPQPNLQAALVQPVDSEKTGDNQSVAVEHAAGVVSTHGSVTPEFHLQFWCYHSGIWVVSAEPNPTPKQHQFVHNLTLYLQGKKKRPKHVGVFSWPMIEAPNIDQSESIAKKYLAQHINQLEQLSPCKKILAFNQAEQWLPEERTVKLNMLLSQSFEMENKRKLWITLMPHRIMK